MLKLVRASATVALFASVASVAVALAGGVAPNGPIVSDSDLALFHIRDAVDVTNSVASSGAQGITMEDALAIADAEVGGLGADIHVLVAQGTRFLDQPPRPVYVVLYRGSFTPPDGPLGGPGVQPARPAVFGIVIDAETGEVWSGFVL